MIRYGMEDIVKMDRLVSSERLEQFFPEAKLGELARPGKIDLLISAREGRLAPQIGLQRVNDLVLWDGPLGKTVSGVHLTGFKPVRPLRRSGGDHMAVRDALRTLHEDGSSQS